MKTESNKNLQAPSLRFDGRENTFDLTSECVEYADCWLADHGFNTNIPERYEKVELEIVINVRIGVLDSEHQLVFLAVPPRSQQNPNPALVTIFRA